MDQVKEYIKLAIKYRFWIAVGISCLLPLIGYFAASGAIRSEADQKKGTIEGADKDVSKYGSGTIPNAQYVPLVKGRHVILEKDVDAAWRYLFNRQASILAWPEKVAERFPLWGRKWPDVDPNAVQDAIHDYATVYDEQVDQVYKTFKPWDPEAGTGIVVAPSKATLLNPVQFDLDALSSTDLNKIWNAQEKLWVQRAMLEIVAKVNSKAKTWDEAPIKQINGLVVASSSAQDQKSAVKPEVFVERPTITATGVAAPAATTSGTTAASGSSTAARMGNSMTSMGKMGGQMGSSGGGMGGGSDAPTDDGVIKFIKSTHSQFEIVPVYISVMIEQDQVAGFLLALEESPMSIQVREFEESIPDSAVEKPEKGKALAGGSAAGGMMGMMSSRMGGKSPGGMGPDAMSPGGMSPGGMNPGGGGRTMGPMGAGGGGQSSSKARDLKKEREARAKKGEEAPAQHVFDPYFNVVQLEVYGQARLFNRPKDEAQPASLAGQTGQPGLTPANPGTPGQPGSAPAKPGQPGVPSTAAATPPAQATAKSEASQPAPAAPGQTPAAAAGAAATTPAKSASDPAKAAAKPEGSPKSEPAKPATETPKGEPASKSSETPGTDAKAEPAAKTETKTVDPTPKSDTAKPDDKPKSDSVPPKR